MALVSVVFRNVWIPSRMVYFSRCYSTSSRDNTRFKYTSRVDIPPQTTALLAGRRWLPGALRPGSKFPDYIASPGDNFPALYSVKLSATSSTSISDFAKDAREIIERELHIHGALLFRGLPLQSGDDFSKFMQGMGYTLTEYEGGFAVRNEVFQDVLTASDDSPEYTIEPHSEMSYLEHYPAKIFFFCDVPPLPDHGGESVITDGRKILPKLDPGLVDKVRRVGVRYCRHHPTAKPGAYLPWQQVFFTEDKADVDKYMNEHGRAYRWEPDGALTYWYNLPAFITHPKTGQEVWFNHLNGHHASYLKDHPLWVDVNIPDEKYPIHTYYGDGSDVEEEVLQHIREVLWEESVGFQMQRGDVIALDNVLALHARLGFKGNRRLLASLSLD
ncbi:dapdiamide synthesis protein DdaC-like isoform X1 [Ptychodera flava]|uniref:dapdiamide synthesis protein DdaC-like isoform X1 n=1 Tax=Ptychodera flava TaxID=63121 RepID=UPI00396A61B4